MSTFNIGPLAFFSPFLKNMLILQNQLEGHFICCGLPGSAFKA